MQGEWKVYLAGAITGKTFGQCTDWRDYTKQKLSYNVVGQFDRCLNDTDGDGDCPACAHGQVDPTCHERERRQTGIVGYSPMRAKEYLASMGTISGATNDYADYVLSSAKGITYRDGWDVMTADLILANLLDTTTISGGTAWELGVAWAKQKPVVMVMEEGNIHDHPILTTSAGWIVPDLDEAINIVKAILLPGGVRVAA